MKIKKLLKMWFAIVLTVLIIVGLSVYYVDPYFHYHKPYTNYFFYELDNERYQNDGIIKNFDYNAIVTGSSMAENFKTSEVDQLFKTNSIKVCFKGSTYKEVNDNIKNALENNEDIKMVIRGLDKNKLIDNPNHLREDLGDYPNYLYDNNPYNDIKYLFNKGAVYRTLKTISKRIFNKSNRGITSFDEYGYWQDLNSFGINEVCPEGIEDVSKGSLKKIDSEQKQLLMQNIKQNVIDIACKYPNIDFYYFITPYSVLWYKDKIESGEIGVHFDAEKIAIEMMLGYPNIKLFFFCDEEDIIADINNYKDRTHYASWINSYILKCMKSNINLITSENYNEHLEKEKELIMSFKYSELNNQMDYKNDELAADKFNYK